MNISPEAVSAGVPDPSQHFLPPAVNLQPLVDADETKGVLRAPQGVIQDEDGVALVEAADDVGVTLAVGDGDEEVGRVQVVQGGQGELDQRGMPSGKRD